MRQQTATGDVQSCADIQTTMCAACGQSIMQADEQVQQEADAMEHAGEDIRRLLPSQSRH